MNWSVLGTKWGKLNWGESWCCSSIIDSVFLRLAKCGLFVWSGFAALKPVRSFF